MTRHDDCPHPATPGARDACRMSRRLIASAERHGLAIEHVVPRDAPTYVFIWQFRIKNPKRSSLNTQLLVTCATGTPSVTLCPVIGDTEKLSWRRAFTWLSVIAI